MAVAFASLLVSSMCLTSARETDGIRFNFDDVDVRLVIKLVAEITDYRFVIAQDVKGRVTFLAPGTIPADQVYAVFLDILEANGFYADRRNDVVFIGRSATAAGLGEVVTASGEEGLPPGKVTRIFRLDNVTPSEMKDLLEPMLSGGSKSVIAFDRTRHLIVTASDSMLERIQSLIHVLDKPGHPASFEVVALKHASAEHTAEKVLNVLKGLMGTATSAHTKKTASAEMFSVVAVDRSNSLILVGTDAEIALMRDIISRMDVESASGKGNLNAIFLKYLSAEEAATTLNALLAKREQKEESAIYIEPNDSNNALLVDASPREFEWLKALIDELDRIPQQVLVDILIIEVKEGDGVDFGVEWSSYEEPEDGKVTLLGRSRPGTDDTVADFLSDGSFPQGTAFGLASGLTSDGLPLIPFLLKALSSKSDVNILSRVPLWAQNNKEASVSVVDNIPILTSTVEGSGSSKDFIQNIDRVDVGIKLTITPYVNIDNEVTMSLNPSIEAIVDNSSSSVEFTPTIAKREVSTTVTVPDEATVVISGLIREDKVQSLSKVPLLGDIPLLGWLFRSKSVRKEKTNLLIFVTPHIVTDVQRAIEMRKELEISSELNAVMTNEVKRIFPLKE